MINRVVKQPCQIANQVRDITSGPWQRCQATAKAVLLAFQTAAMRQGRKSRWPGISDNKTWALHRGSGCGTITGAPELSGEGGSMTWPGPSAWPQAKRPKVCSFPWSSRSPTLSLGARQPKRQDRDLLLVPQILESKDTKAVRKV